MAQGLIDGEHPGDILNNFPDEYLDTLQNWKGAIQTLQLISASLRDSTQVSDTTSYWVSPAEVKKLISDSTTFKIYLGLLYEQARHFNNLNNTDSIRFDKTSLCAILDTVGRHFKLYYSSYKTYFTNLSNSSNTLMTTIANCKKAPNDSLALERYYGCVNATIDFLQEGSDVRSLFPFNSDMSKNKVDEFWQHAKDNLAIFFNVARSAVNIVWDIKRRSYASAIVGATSIFRTVITESSDSDIVKLKKLLSDQRELADNYTNHQEKVPDSTSRQIDSLKAKLPELQNATVIMNSLLKYGTFMATIVQAQNSDQVESAIEAFALPVGSYRTKRESLWNVSLNAYVGPFMGYEAINGLNSQQIKMWQLNSYGLTAPIGIAFNKGSSCDWSYSIFVSLVDIGAIAAFRFTGDSTSQVPTIHLADIISPGGFISIGTPWPVSFNFGVQMGPNLHSVSSTVNSYSGAVYYRYSASICVDIPLLDFYTKPRN